MIVMSDKQPMGADRLMGSGYAINTAVAYNVNTQNSTGKDNEYKSLRTQWAEIPADERWKKIVVLLTVALFGAYYLFMGFLFIIS